MPDIIHRVAIRASREDVYRALSEQSGLARWWTTDTEAQPEVGATARFMFSNKKWVVDMKVEELVPNQRVVWRCTSGPAEWVGTAITFDLATEDGKTMLRFGHRGWVEAVDFMGHCSAKWAYFLFSLKGYLEAGAGTPHPHDLQI